MYHPHSPMNPNEVSPLFTRTKFGRNFMRIGFNDDNSLVLQRTRSAESTRAPQDRNYYNHHHNGNDLAYDSYDEEEERMRRLRSDSQSIGRGDARTSTVRHASSGAIYSSRNGVSQKPKAKSSSGHSTARVPQAILYDQRVLKSLQTQRMKHSYADREAKWNNRFHLDPMPQYDVTQDIHARLFTSSSIFKSSAKRKERNRYNLNDILTEKKSNGQSTNRSSRTQRASQLPAVKRGIAHHPIYSEQNSTFDSIRAANPPIFYDSPYADHDQLFDKLVTRIRKLWKDLRISKRERREFAEIYMLEPTKENIAVLSQEVQKLTEYRANTILTLKNITEREAQLVNLQQLILRLKGTDLLEGRNSITRDVKSLLTNIRISTLEVVESINRWRSRMSHQKPFIWQQQNYLLKIMFDLNFFVESSLSSLINKTTNLYQNPFMMPGIEFGVSPNVNRSSSPSRTDSPIDQSSSISNLLSPQKDNVETKKSDPFKERIMRAQDILFKELELYNLNISNEPQKEEKILTEEESIHVLQRIFRKQHVSAQHDKYSNEVLEMKRIVMNLMNMGYYSEQYQQKRDTANSSVTSIQRIFKGHRTRRAMKESKRQYDEQMRAQHEQEKKEYENERLEKRIIKLQSAIRTTVPLSQKDGEDKNTAVTLIQRQFKHHSSSMIPNEASNRENEKQQRRALTFLQATIRAIINQHILKNKLTEREHSAGTSTKQAEGSKKTEEKELEEKVLVAQKIENKDDQKEKAEPGTSSQSLETQNLSAAKIQKQWRRVSAKRKCEAQKKLHEANMKKQNEQERMDYSATKIQQSYRQHRARRIISELQKKHDEEMKKEVADERARLNLSLAE